jgi:tRNA(Met) cytidine acetyltransferase
LINRSLLLDADLGGPGDAAPLSVERVEIHELARDEPRLRAVVALLVNAHYQTRPSDLRQLLDNPDGELWLACAGADVVGVLLGLHEGGFDPAMVEQVLTARRRPRGHLLPQSLAVHAGLDDCLRQRVLRVQRIAVHPQRRREGVATRLLDAAGSWAADNDIDLLGCAFGVELPLLAFWQGAGLHAVRLGLRIDPASATHSLFMLRAISVRGQVLVDGAVRRFQADLPWALAAGFRDIDAHLALALLRGRDCTDLPLSDAERRDLARIVCGARQSSTATALVWRCVVRLAAEAGASDDGLAALVGWQLQHCTVDVVCRRYAIAGRGALETLLRRYLEDRLIPSMRDG